jgi:LuxR family maltose regulon positive regulatory protein
VYHFRQILRQALVNRCAKLWGTDRLRDLAYNAALYYEMHDRIVPALRLFEQCGKTDRIRSLLIRNARRNPGNGHYFELRRYYLNLKEGDTEGDPVLMAGMSMLYSLLMQPEESEGWYDKLKAFSASAEGAARSRQSAGLSGHRAAPSRQRQCAGRDAESSGAAGQGRQIAGILRDQQSALHHERRQRLLPLVEA